jgi:CMP-N-acetylneuraminic acid synthetase
MKKFLEEQKKKVESVRDKLQKKYDDMGYTYENRSDEWQDSDKGIEYEERLYLLSEAIDDSQILIGSLEVIINDL